MNFRLPLIALLSSLLPAPANELLCRHAAPGAPGAPGVRSYAPDRLVDILHLAIDVTPDFKKRTVAGHVTLTFKPIAKPLTDLRLDATKLTILSLDSAEKLTHHATDKDLTLLFDPPIPAGKETKVTIHYRAEPKKGLYFRTPEMGYPTTDLHLFTQGEATEARHWYPCYDHPNEKFTSEVTCRVAPDLTVLSNGRLISSTLDPKTGLLAVRWLQDKPHVNYLISLVAGYWKKVEDKHRDIPLEFWTTPSDFAQAANSFAATKDMMAFFEQEIGVPYPWDKYAQVCVHDYGWGGMENTSITTLNNRTLFTLETENLFSSDSLVAHELAHQWFGDLVTCADWSHVWLNEGFATYYDMLYDGHKNGRDSMNWHLYHAAKGIVSQANETRGIVTRKFASPDEMFNYLAYPKGAWILHMLRSQLGETLFRTCVKTYLERFKFGSVTTDDFRKVLEELSGRSLDQFFDQWVHHIGQPTLDASYSYDPKTRLAKLNLRQTQKVSDDALLFRFPLTIRFKSKAGTVDRTITVKDAEEDFYFPLTDTPEIVRLDPDLTLLAKINFTPSTPMLYAQLADSTDTVGRVIAAEVLGKNNKDQDTISRLKKALTTDPFHGVRIKASEALKTIHTDEAVAALAASTTQPDARVRNAVVADLGANYHPDAKAHARTLLGGTTEKNPGIQATALRALGPFASPATHDLILKYLSRPSYRDRLADAAIAAMRAQDSPLYATPLRQFLQERAPTLPPEVLARARETLGHLARNEPQRNVTRDYLLTQLDSPMQRIKLATINALGNLEDPVAITPLETYTTATADTPEHKAASAALNKIRAARKAPEELSTLRQEFLDLQKTTRDLRKELDSLKKRLDATPAKPAEVKPSTPTAADPKPSSTKPSAPKPAETKPEAK